jgi:hypothetical protein
MALWAEEEVGEYTLLLDEVFQVPHVLDVEVGRMLLLLVFGALVVVLGGNNPLG